VFQYVDLQNLDIRKVTNSNIKVWMFENLDKSKNVGTHLSAARQPSPPVPARALCRPPSSATDNSLSTGHLQLSPPPLSPPWSPPHPGVPRRPLHRCWRVLLRPLTGVPPRSTCAVVVSLIGEPSTSPTPPIWFLPLRWRSLPPSPPAPGFRLTGINRRHRGQLPCLRGWAVSPGWASPLTQLGWELAARFGSVQKYFFIF
jgi:hypothetical protein